MEVIKISEYVLNKAISVLKKGGVVICPTDTVYGFLADACNKKAVEKIYKIKKRPRLKSLAVFVRDIKMARELVEINKKQEKILKKHWPGRYTFVLKRQNPCEVGSHTKSHMKLYGVDKKTIALRIPKYKFLNDLLKKINKPLAQTSANISGQPPLTKIADIIALVKNCRTSGLPQILMINAGNLPKSKPSAIINLTKNKIKIVRK